MLLSDLVGANVVSTDGRELGRVHDLLLVRDGPVGARGLAGLRLQSLAVGRRWLGTKLGYTQGTVRGPWLLRAVFARPPLLVPWTAIVHRDPGRIVVDTSRLDASAGASLDR
jgi:hypothetical protein